MKAGWIVWLKEPDIEEGEKHIMEFTINQKTLVNALKTIAPAVGKGRVEFLKLVHIECVAGFATFKATNLDLTISASEKVFAPESGSVCLNHKELTDLVSKLPKGADVTLRDLGGDYAETILTCGNIRRPLSSLPVEEFPALPKTGVEGFHQFNLGNQGTLHRALERVLPCVATGEEARTTLQGVLFEVDSNRETIVSTDGRRGMKLEFSSSDKVEPWKMIVPGRDLKVLAKLIKDPKAIDQPCVLFYEEGRVWTVVSTGQASSVEWVSICVDGTYPEYKRVFPQNFSRFWEINSDSLKGPIERAMLSNEGLNKDIVVFNFIPGQHYFTVSISGEDDTKGAEKFEAEIHGKSSFLGAPLRIALNGKYLLDLLKSPIGNNQVWKFQDETRAMVISDRSSMFDWQFVIMPIKLRQPAVEVPA